MIRFLVFGFTAVVLSACSRPPERAAETPSFYLSMASSTAAVDAAMARDMVSTYRHNQGLGPLKLDPELQAAAQAEASAMAAADKPSSADTVKNRISALGFSTPAANLSAGYHTLAEAFSGWRESPPHNRVLLDPFATRIGIATAYAPHSKYKVYWAMVVAADKR